MKIKNKNRIPIYCKSREIFILLILLITLIPCICIGQVDSVNTPKKTNTKKKKTEIKFSSKDDSLLYYLPKNAKNLIKKGDKILLFGPTRYEDVLKFYKEAWKLYSDDAFLNYKLGAFYYISNNSIILTKRYLEKAEKKHEILNPDIYYYLGCVYHEYEQLEKAKEHYNRYIESINSGKKHLSPYKKEQMITELNKRVEECNNGIELKKVPLRVFIDDIGSTINTNSDEYFPFIVADETKIYFTSRRLDTKGGKIAEIDANYYEDIYYSYNNRDEWTEATNLGGRMNKKTNDAIIGLSFDGNTMFIYRDVQLGDIYISKQKGRSWSALKSLKTINSEYHESAASITADGQTIYFVSNRPGSIGKHDIFVSKLIKKNKWTAPTNIGDVINTPYDENCVYIHPDGKTLYFSSKGHNSMGGFDIFSSELLENGKWSKPKNIGYPINSVNDDICFMISLNNKKAYFSSVNSKNSKDKDIYTVEFLGDEKEGAINTEDHLLAGINEAVTENIIEPVVNVKVAKITIVKGIIKDQVTLEKIGADIEITDNEKNEIVANFESNSFSGKYMALLPSGKNYGIAVKAKNYLFHSENFNIPASVEYQVVEKNIDLNKLFTGSKIVLNNVFYDTDKTDLTKASNAELDRLVKLMNEFGHLVIEISGHTDDVGSAEYNHDLSERRAKKVVDYISSKGIDKRRLYYRGYGFDQPIASNDTEEGKQLNRRTEFKILSMDFEVKKQKRQLEKEETEF